MILATVSPSSILLSVAVVAFVAWRLHARYRRWLGRQAYKPLRFWSTVVVCPPLLVLMFFVSLSHEPRNALWMLVGVAVGVALGIVGLKATKFEAGAEGLFYTPNTVIGVGLTLLFVARVAYRLGELWIFNDPHDAMSTDLARSPATLAIFATLLGHFLTYAIGLLRWRRRVRAQEAPPPAV